ncbi:hypothetical protein AVEN_96013-1 [Araneus ventricosus]|uniref:Reverse transcriptase domain-containing protein n=1 Tax=Araneus ventricosus TaxID=182803 RepID=A0A4Y2B3Z4_ARAVE|nr:hypothetical protein AVEN_96013-1 [Araneus ventricosus]
MFIPPRRTPQLILYNVDKEIEMDILKEGLLSKNLFLADENNKSHFRVEFKIPARDKSNNHWVISVNPKKFIEIRDKGGLYFQWVKLRTFEFIGVKQCKQCFGFGHTSKVCDNTGEPKCDRCGETIVGNTRHRCRGFNCINCIQSNARFNTDFGISHICLDKRGPSENFIGVNPNNDPNNTIEDKINYLMDNFFPNPSSEDNLDYIPIIGTEPMVLEDIEMVINALKGGKAPDLDRIDFRMRRAVFIHDKEFTLDLINICFKFNYFPEHLRNAKVFFLLKDDKDPGLCTSYRPVCLLPTLGKIIERLFLLQLNKWLDRNNIIHHNIFHGFREGKSCDLAIHDLIETIKIGMPSEHLALVSLDIKSVFDTMNWPVLFKTLESYGFPAFFKNFVYFYLKNRRVFYTNDVLEISRPCSKGCPQGSVIDLQYGIYILTLF